MSEPAQHSNRISATHIIVPAALLGIAMIGMALFITQAIQGQDALAQWYPIQDRWWVHAITGIAIGIFAAIAINLITASIPTLKQMQHTITQTIDLTTLSPLTAILLGLLAGVPEEILFRGSLQPILGLIITAIIFGGLHAISRSYIIYAVVAGFILGSITEFYGDIWAATTAHVSYDAMLLWLWSRHQSNLIPEHHGARSAEGVAERRR